MKDIILFTVPHSGTHTVHYVFNHLLNVRVWWGHFEQRNTHIIDQLLELMPDPDRFVHVQTHRSRKSLLQSYSKRDGGIHMDYLGECLDTYDKYRDRINAQLGNPLIIDIEELPLRKTNQVLRICDRLGVKPDENAWKYLSAWEPINSQLNPHDPKKQDVINSIRAGHIKQLVEKLKGEQNGS